MSDGKTAVLTRKSPLEKFASFCGSAAAWLAALVLFGLAAASLIARMDLLDVSTLAEGKALRVGLSLPELLLSSPMRTGPDRFASWRARLATQRGASGVSPNAPRPRRCETLLLRGAQNQRPTQRAWGSRRRPADRSAGRRCR